MKPSWEVNVGASSSDEVIRVAQVVRDGCDDPLVAATIDLCIAEIGVWRAQAQLVITLANDAETTESGP